jgi:DNA-binding transcriptional regulator YiaG
MPNIAKVLKEEIARISRKEARTAVGKLHTNAIRLRKNTADLRNRVAALEKENKQLSSLLEKVGQSLPSAAPEAAEKIRITAKGIRSLRRKLGLSQTKFAKLLGVSTQIVQIWAKKTGALKVRETTKAAIRSIRGIGAREARQRLEEMQAAKKTRKPVSVRRRKKK